MARTMEKQPAIKIIIRTVSVGKYYDPQRGLWMSQEVEALISEYVDTGLWKLRIVEFLGYEPYLENPAHESGVKLLFILERVQPAT